jgi:hypothetical protein
MCDDVSLYVTRHTLRLWEYLVKAFLPNTLKLMWVGFKLVSIRQLKPPVSIKKAHFVVDFLFSL